MITGRRTCRLSPTCHAGSGRGGLWIREMDRRRLGASREVGAHRVDGRQNHAMHSPDPGNEGPPRGIEKNGQDAPETPHGPGERHPPSSGTRRPLPEGVLIAVVCMWIALDITTGVPSNLGLGGPWSAASVAASVGVGFLLINDRRHNRRPTLGEALAVLLFAVSAWFVADDKQLRQRLHKLETQYARALARPSGQSVRRYDFIVTSGEYDPRPDYGSSDSDHAYERIQPDATSQSPGTSYQRGAHVKVVCFVNNGFSGWYRLPDGNFLDGSLIEASPNSGQGRPPACPK